MKGEFTSLSYVCGAIVGRISIVVDQEDDGDMNASGAALMASR